MATLKVNLCVDRGLAVVLRRRLGRHDDVTLLLLLLLDLSLLLSLLLGLVQ